MKIDILSVEKNSTCITIGFLTEHQFKTVDLSPDHNYTILRNTILMANNVLEDMYQFLDNLPEIETFLEEQSSLLDAEKDNWNENDYYYRMCIDFILKMLGK